MADNKYKILLRRGNKSDLNTAFYDIGEPIFLSDSGKLLIKKNDGTMAVFSEVVESKNLFDMTSYLNFLNKLATKSIENGTLDNIDSSSFTFTTTGHGCYTNGWSGPFNTNFKIQVQQNTTYTMSWDFSGSDGSTFVFFNGVIGSGNMVQTKNSKMKLTFTTKEDTTFITVRFGIDDGGASATIGNIQIEVGDNKTYYLPNEIAQGIKELDNKVDDLQVINNQNKKDLDLKKLDKTDFENYKTSNDNAVKGKVNATDFNNYKSTTDKVLKDNADNIKLLDTNKANLVQSKNLFDMIAYVNLLSTIAKSITKGTLNACTDNSFTITSNDTDCYTNLWTSSENDKFTIIVEPNTTYTLSWECEGASGNVFVFSNATTTKMWQVVNSKKQLIFTTDNDTTFVTVRFGVANANQTATYSNIQIELGEVATNYMPCKVATGVKELDNKIDKLQDLNNTKFNDAANEIISNSIKNTTDKASNIVITDSSNYNIVSLVTDNDNYNVSLYGKNLLNYKEFVKTLHTNAFVAQGSTTVVNNTISYDMTEGSYCGIYFKYNEFVKDSLLIDKPCVISLTIVVDKSCTFRLLDENSNKSVSKVLEPDTETRISLPITLSQSTKAITFYGKNITETTHIKLSNIMIELGSVATDYEDYKDMQSVAQDTDLSTVHTYCPNTTVIADSNVQMSYIADTKHYIDNKFKELATAIVAHESEVM